MRKFIIDADTGSDDAVAILLALQNKEIDVLGITVVSGNVPLEQGVKNTLSTIEAAKQEIKVFAGAEKPLMRDYVEIHGLTEFTEHVKSLSPISASAQSVHGVDGMGDIGVTPKSLKYEEKKAVDFLIDEGKRESDAEKYVQDNLFQLDEKYMADGKINVKKYGVWFEGYFKGHLGDANICDKYYEMLQ